MRRVKPGAGLSVRRSHHVGLANSIAGLAISLVGASICRLGSTTSFVANADACHGSYLDHGCSSKAASRLDPRRNARTATTFRV
jgi:hypothetical protein